MRRLVYCILNAGALGGARLPPGANGTRVSLLTDHGLSAACSLADDVCARPDVSTCVAYARVVQELHERATVVPMRYGCLLGSEEEVSQLLCRRRDYFKAVLAELDGCVEMGMRALLPAMPPRGARRMAAGMVRSSGAAYLAARQTVYGTMDASYDEADAVIHAIQAAFSVHVVKCRSERSLMGDRRVVSVCFLVRRDEVASLREAFRRFQEEIDMKLLLTGPWPPYSFVVTEPWGRML